MRRGRSGRDRGASDGARIGAHPPAPLREAELPVRGRGGIARVGGVELLAGREDEVLDAAGGRGSVGAGGHRTVPRSEGPAGRAGQRGTGGTASPAAADAGELGRQGRPFAASEQLFAGLVGFLTGTEAAGLTHEELESRLSVDGRELQRQLLQEHLDLRAAREARLTGVTDAGGHARPAVETGHSRALTTVFGTVTVDRLAYRAPGAANLHPADAALNLPAERHSHGLRALAAVEASRGSYDECAAAIARATGVRLGKRQCEVLTARAAVDFEPFYAQRRVVAGDPGDILVISADGKGVVMRPDALRASTAKAAGNATPKLASRLSKGEKRNRKRMAELAAVYDVRPVPRTPADILPAEPRPDPPLPGPVAANKWLTASVVEDAATVIAAAFTEADRRDPAHQRTWVALVDGNNHQIDRIAAEAKARGVRVTILIDVVHVLEYLWSAAWSFFAEGDPGAEAWVADKARAVLEGKAGIVVAAIRRKATCLHLDARRRANADTCAHYLHRKRAYLDYPTALAGGWPIATGVIEGACRHIARDRMDVTGARWGLVGAEAVLKLRAIRANGDWPNYWRYHLGEEHRRIHQSQYANHIIPTAQAA